MALQEMALRDLAWQGGPFVPWGIGVEPGGIRGNVDMTIAAPWLLLPRSLSTRVGCLARRALRRACLGPCCTRPPPLHVVFPCRYKASDFGQPPPRRGNDPSHVSKFVKKNADQYADSSIWVLRYRRRRRVGGRARLCGAFGPFLCLRRGLAYASHAHFRGAGLGL